MRCLLSNTYKFIRPFNQFTPFNLREKFTKVGPDLIHYTQPTKLKSFCSVLYHTDWKHLVTVYTENI